MYELFEEFLDALTNWSILAFEFVGICVLIISGIRGIHDYFTHNPNIRLILAEGMALSLEFKLGSEILRTVIVRDLSELVFIAGIIILRASLTYLIHWEIDYEEKNKKGEQLEDLITDKGSPKPDLAQKVLNMRFGKSEETLRKKAQEKYNAEQTSN